MTTECQIEEDHWADDDTECVLAGGICQFDSLSCDLSKDSHYFPEKCGGPEDRRCCRIPSNEQTTKSSTIPTVSTIATTPEQDSGK